MSTGVSVEADDVVLPGAQADSFGVLDGVEAVTGVNALDEGCGVVIVG